MAHTATQHDPVATTYAQALYELAEERGELATVIDQVAGIRPLMAPGSESGLDRLLDHPAVDDESKRRVLHKAFEWKLAEPLYKFIMVVAKRGRAEHLHAILSAFETLVAHKQGRLTVGAEVAVELPPESVSSVAGRIGEALGKTVTLEQRVEPDLIGGIRLRIGDTLIDGSVAAQLRSLRTRLTQRVTG